MKTKKFIMLVMAAAVMLSSVQAFDLRAFAAESVSCEEKGCDGVYENGFCTKDAAHYQAAKKVSTSHHSELNSTHNGYYAIENAGQLYWFAKQVDDTAIGTCTQNSNRYTPQTYVKVNAVLTDDIVDNKNVLDKDGKLNSGTFREYNPIGTVGITGIGVFFYGMFDGNGKTISGLYCKKDISDDSNAYIALIASISGLSGNANVGVKNVTVKDSYFSGNKNIGGVVGSLGSGTVENCHSYATVKGGSGVGGVIGSTGYSSATIAVSNSTNHGDVYGENMVGGFVGDVNYNKLANCANFGNVFWEGNESGYMGGFAGYVSYNAELTNCFNSGDVTYTQSNQFDNCIGGFVGCLTSGKLKNCYTTGKVTTATYKNSTQYLTGGFAGSASANNLTNCYFNPDNVTKGGEKVTSGIGKSNAEYIETQLCAVSTEEIKSGKLAYKLNGDQTSVVFKQTLKTDSYPTFSGEQVYFSTYFEKYYNLDYAILGIKSGKAGVVAPAAGTYTLVFADYDGGALKAAKTVTNVTFSEKGEKSVDVPTGITLESGDKLMLWGDMTLLKPLCSSYIIEQ